MLATLPTPRRPRRSATSVRKLLLEITYRMHATRAVRPVGGPRRPSWRPSAPR